MTSRVYFNGRIVSSKDAAISIDDHGFLYGDGVYETVRVYAGRPFRLDAHLARLEYSCRGVRLKTAPSSKKLSDAVIKTIKANRLSDAVVRITVTRGPGPRGLDPANCPAATVLITAVPMLRPAPALYSKGVTAAIVSVRRNDSRSIPPSIKSISCLNGVLAKMEAIDRRAFEAILLTTDGVVAEGTVTNVFVVKGGVVQTPHLDGSFLAGVTRDSVLKLARQSGYPVREGRITPRELTSADEVFLTSTVLEILPVTRIIPEREPFRPNTVADGRPGPITRSLIQRYREMTDPTSFRTCLSGRQASG